MRQSLEALHMVKIVGAEEISGWSYPKENLRFEFEIQIQKSAQVVKSMVDKQSMPSSIILMAVQRDGNSVFSA